MALRYSSSLFRHAFNVWFEPTGALVADVGVVAVVCFEIDLHIPSLWVRQSVDLKAYA